MDVFFFYYSDSPLHPRTKNIKQLQTIHLEFFFISNINTIHPRTGCFTFHRSSLQGC